MGVNNTIYGDAGKYSGVLNVTKFKDINPDRLQLILLPADLVSRLEDNGKSLDDILDLDAIADLLTMRELKLVFNDIDACWSTIFASVVSSTSDFSYSSILSADDVKISEATREKINRAITKYSLEKISLEEIKKFYIGQKNIHLLNSTKFNIRLHQLTSKVYAIQLLPIEETHAKTITEEEYTYMLCEVICDKLQAEIGLRKLAKTNAFNKLISISKSSVLIRHS